MIMILESLDSVAAQASYLIIVKISPFPILAQFLARNQEISRVGASILKEHHRGLSQGD